MPLALVTGAPPLLGPAAAALGRAGFDVVAWQTAADVESSAAGPFDCYLQLPCGPMRPAGRGAPAAPDLVCRIDGLAAIAGRLRPDASVILGVVDDDPPGDLFAAVALALLEDLGRPAARIAVLPVADLCRPPEKGLPLVVPGAQWETPTPPLVSAP